MKRMLPRPLSVWLQLLFFLFASGPVSATDVSFSGSLIRLGSSSISVRLQDRRIVDAVLPETAAISGKYNVGDEVEITCKPIHPIFEKSTSRYQSLEVTSMRLVRRPSFEERSETSQPTTADSSHGGEALEHARQVNLQYLANMPNFVADETARRSRSSANSPRWRDYDTVQSEITFQGRNAVRRQIRRNGKPWTQPFEALPGFKWYEGFATEIKPLFDPGCSTRIEYQGTSLVGERHLKKYQFSSPSDGCFPFFYFDYQRYNPARSGHLYIDDPGGNVFQIDEVAEDFPTQFEFAGREEQVFWDYVKIGNDSHLLPVRANFLVSYRSGTRYRVEVAYKNHRHFESSSNVTFQ
jgi:hypothetical protein